MMRLCLDEDGMSWEDATAAVRRRFRLAVYEGTEGILLDGEQMRLVLPRIFAILSEIARRHREDGIRREGGFDVGALLRWTLEKEKELPSEKYCGFSPTAWSRFGGGGFSRWADRHVGEGWRRSPELFCSLDRARAGDAGRELLAQKHQCREELAAFLRPRQEAVPDEEKPLFVLTGSITGRHRTLLALLRMLYYYDRARAGASVPSLCLVLGGKAPPSDALGKEILRFAWHLGWELRGDFACRDRLQIVVIENYNGRASEILLPAADVFEHLTLPGMGGVGTDAYAALSLGGLLLSTKNGMASLHAKEAGGVVLFGMTGEEADKSWREGYRAIRCLRSDPALRAAVSRLSRRIYGAEFPLLYDYLTQSGGRIADPYFCLADLASYVAATEEMTSLLADAGERAKRMLSAVGGLSEWMRGYA
jgi:glucan phosphorylase